MAVDKHANHFELAVQIHATCNVKFGRDDHHSRVTVDLYICLPMYAT